MLRSAMASSLPCGPAASAPWFVAIGASGSTGLRDIQALLTALGPNIDAVVLIVLHRPFSHPSKLRNILARATGMQVVIAKNGERFERSCCYVGEPAAHLSLAARSFGAIVEDRSAYHRNRTVDLLFHSVAAYGGSRTIGVILSGALDDGSRGLAAIHGAGGRTMVLPRSPFLLPTECPRTRPTMTVLSILPARPWRSLPPFTGWLI
jgi:two-component system, chemotaxis family, protein-glutamate methylesterase/glutaminase